MKYEIIGKETVGPHTKSEVIGEVETKGGKVVGGTGEIVEPTIWARVHKAVTEFEKCGVHWAAEVVTPGKPTFWVCLIAPGA